MAKKGSLLSKATTALDLFPDDAEVWERIIADNRISPGEMRGLCTDLHRSLEQLETKLPDELVPDVHRVLSQYELILAAVQYSVDATQQLFTAIPEDAGDVTK